MRKRISIEKQKRIYGYVFLVPWIIGLIIFFLKSLLQTIRFSFGEMYITPDNGGYYLAMPDGGFWGQYIRAFTKDADFVRYLTESLQKLIYEVPVIVVFSLVVAMILNQNFKGRTFMRAVFFLPVIIASGVIIVTMKDSLNGVAVGGGNAANIFSSEGLYQLLIEFDVPQQVATFFSTAVNNVVDTVWRAGVQILLFMSGLLSIPPSYYEVAAVEGSTPWESFWKITFPMLLPIILVNVIYTIVDSFSSYGNTVMRHITNVMTRELSISYGSALYWIYFIIIFAVLGVVYLIFSRSAHYEV